MRSFFFSIALLVSSFASAEGTKEAQAPKTVIVLDAGHGGHDVGAKVHALQEKKLSLLTTLLTKKYLDQMGYKVILTRSRDIFLPLQKRVSLANNSKAKLFVSIHYNASKNNDAKGIEVYYCHTDQGAKTKASKILASTVLSSLAHTTEAISRGVKGAKFHVIRETQMPSILVEAGFITNKEERGQLKDRSYLEKIAKGVAAGIDSYCRS